MGWSKDISRQNGTARDWETEEEKAYRSKMYWAKKIADLERTYQTSGSSSVKLQLIQAKKQLQIAIKTLDEIGSYR